ncbi:MAG: nucleotidyltransferase domain-containing protein [Limnochordia bacterium]|jgi:hypothetical protein|nr:nucleotidyltransferase domain-containing protein [Limnochordia bacterium]
MEAWEKAVELFLVEWIQRDEFAGALVCGSFVTGDPTSHSDIDLHIVLSDSVDWRERGNRYVDRFLIEYFANSPRQIRRYFADDFANFSTSSMVQFITGKIICDPQGILSVLKEEAMTWRAKRYLPLASSSVEMRKYHLWDTFDNLCDCYEHQQPDFDFVYHQSLLLLFQGYCAILNVEQIPFGHISRYLSDPAYLHKYLKAPFPDPDFSCIFLEAMTCQDSVGRMRRYDSLLNHVFQKSGGFQVDGWRLRTPAEEQP